MAFFTAQRNAQFAESDAAGVIHFSCFALYVEEAEHDLLATFGFPIQLHGPEALHWPRVSFEASYTGPLLPFEKVQVELDPEEVGERSICWAWRILKTADGAEVAAGSMKTVCCRFTESGLTSTPLPADLKTALTNGA
jgi:4-hydroxybenzoyl-CoA thioesterase/acyl-CoA thioester hydrolase